MDDSRFLHLINKTPPNTIIVLEDIDCAFRDRRKDIEGDPRYIGATGGVTHSGLLNAIDGVTNSDGRIVIMTTNYKDRLDPALVSSDANQAKTLLNRINFKSGVNLSFIKT